MNCEPTRIALIHAVQVAMAPVEAAFQKCWPQAQRFNLLDDGLSPDLERHGLNEAMVARIHRLADHAIAAGAQGILYTCSAFGDAIASVAAAARVPVLKPNQAMFEAALRAGQRIGMLATFASAVAPMEDEFRAMATSLGSSATLETVCVPAALAAARAGDLATHNRLVVEAAPQLAHCDVLMLAHFSTSPALESVQAVISIPVLSAPESAVQTLREKCLAHA